MDFSAVQHTLGDLKKLLGQLPDEDYTASIHSLGDSSIGQHTRHIVELFQCLLDSYTKGKLNYDDRNRDKQTESDSGFAMAAIDSILQSIEKENISLILTQSILGKPVVIETNYFREVLYNLEHCIHHQALIKVAAYQLENIAIPENFGVAPSTIEYRKQCAQ